MQLAILLKRNRIGGRERRVASPLPFGLTCSMENNCIIMSPKLARETAIARALYHAESEPLCDLFTLRLSFAERGLAISEAWKRFHTFRTNRLGKWIETGRYFIVLELQRDGTPHFHLLGVSRGIGLGSVYSGMDGKFTALGSKHIEAFRYFKKLGEDEVSKARSRRAALGYFQFSPLWGSARGAVLYFAKYMTKEMEDGVESRPVEWVVRLVDGVEVETVRKSRFFSFGSQWKVPSDCCVAGPVTRAKWRIIMDWCSEHSVSYEHLGDYVAERYYDLRLWDAWSVFWREELLPWYEFSKCAH